MRRRESQDALPQRGRRVVHRVARDEQPALANAPVSKPVLSVSDCTRRIRDGVVPRRRRDLHMRGRGALAEFDGADGDLVGAVVAQGGPRIRDVFGGRRRLVEELAVPVPISQSSPSSARLRRRAAPSSTRSMHCGQAVLGERDVVGVVAERQQRVAGPNDVAAPQFQRIDVERERQLVDRATRRRTPGWVMP